MPIPVLASDTLSVEGAPTIPGLVFRRFRGESDYPDMLAVIEASSEADDIERSESLESVAHTYAHLVNSDPYSDMIFVEIEGRVAGYGRAFWWAELDGTHFYSSTAYVDPAWSRKGIGRAMLGWLEQRLREVAASHPADSPKYFQHFANHNATGTLALLEEAGYVPVRFFHEMVRPSLDDIPDFPLPEGLEIRPVRPEHYRPIWDAQNEAFRDHWGFAEPDEEEYRGWLDDKTVFHPELWQIAWDIASDEIAGQVRTFINHGENEKYNRRRGYTEFISVRRPWRRRGLARALIAASLRVQKEQGMTESALGVDSENISGATRVYEACGFRVTNSSRAYRKAL